MNVVLFEPKIPQNTGNIVRTCAVVGAKLFLVKPLGFHITDRWLKRAGLDYWDEVDIFEIDDFESFVENGQKRFFFYSAHASKRYTDAEHQEEDYLVFGSEDAGLPQKLWKQYGDHFYTLPKRETARCLNLSNAVSIVLYEAWRQLDFANL